ncbi:AraC family transcriptional regulator [Streptomyces sp. NPDC002262]|uniref:helix-turn-helix domain-containing protein n=1 Tax=Streptomyces sp. NPDC002262 TaxID=3154414 RepID=UPI003320C545
MPVSRRTVLRTDGLLLADVSCDCPPRGWTETRPAPVFGFVLVRRGMVHGRVDGREQVLDPASVYVERPGSEQQFSHPHGGDVYTEIVLAEPVLAGLLGGDPAVPQGLVFTTPDVALAHRVLLGRGRADGDAFELAERVTALAALLLGRLAPDRVEAGRPGSAAARRRMVDEARTVLNDDPLRGLEEVSRLVGCSPHHLSRIFATATGMSLTRYRNGLRVTRALERLADGERDLAGLAHELGFTDQAHLTHVVRDLAGLPPGRLRALLNPPPPTGERAAPSAGK